MPIEDNLVPEYHAFNPYRIGLYYIRRRLSWDFNIESWKSRRKMRKWKNRYLGRKAVICCNGPSLNNVDFDEMSGIFSIGLNKINLLFSRSSFRPSCIVSINKFVIEQNSDFFNETEIPLFIGNSGVAAIKSRENVNFVHTVPSSIFSTDASLSVGENATVTNVALQIAFYLGFRQVAIVGADHNYSQAGKPNETVKASGDELNHFDPNYFPAGVSWQLADLAQSEIGYFVAKKTFEAAGGEIVNATVGGQLEIFQRKTLSEFVGS